MATARDDGERTGRDGRPMPASQPMSRETADWYASHTGGQLVPFLHDDGNWYLYAPKPVQLPEVLPTVKR